MAPANYAAWIESPQAHPLVVKSAPYPVPQPDQLVVKNAAVAINVLDAGLQDAGKQIFKWLKYPCIYGCDVAGEVVQVGSEAASSFRVGDRVLAVATGCDPDSNNSAEAAFQNYTVVLARMASKIPDALTYERAAVLPLALATAASGLFYKDYMALQPPSVHAKPPTGETVLIWGGSTSVGVNAVQLAVAAGYEVFATASPRNSDYVKKLGAREVFDYNDKAVIDQLVRALETKTMAGAFACGYGSLLACIDVLARTNGSKFVADISGPDIPRGKLNPVKVIPAFVGWSMAVWFKRLRKGVETKFCWGSELKKSDLSTAIFGDFLPRALEMGSYVVGPEPEVVGKGLEHIQDGIDRLRQGVSLKKLVVTL